MNEQNLIPNYKRTHEELAEMGRKGGVASGIKRRHNADIKKRFLSFMEYLSENEARVNIEKTTNGKVNRK